MCDAGRVEFGRNWGFMFCLKGVGGSCLFLEVWLRGIEIRVGRFLYFLSEKLDISVVR